MRLEPVNTNLGPEPVNTNLGPGPLNTNWGPGPVNTNWGTEQKPGQGVGKYKDPLNKRKYSRNSSLRLLIPNAIAYYDALIDFIGHYLKRGRQI